MPTRNSLQSDLHIPFWQFTADPAAGAEGIITLGGATSAELLSLSFTLTTDANIADRLVYLEWNTAAVYHTLGAAESKHPANGAIRYVAHSYVCFPTTPHPIIFSIPIPKIPHFQTGNSIRIRVNNIQVGDQISLIYSIWKLRMNPV